jgi:ATP-dependent Clp protease ATP-binding subunit ClpB
MGATTTDEFRKYIEKDAALARRFQAIQVVEPTVEDTVTILRGLRDKYEIHHGVTITDEALEAAAQLSSRYIPDRRLPDKAIDVIDEAASRLRLSHESLPASIRAIEESLADLTSRRLHSLDADENSTLREDVSDDSGAVAELQTKKDAAISSWQRVRIEVAEVRMNMNQLTFPTFSHKIKFV